MSKKVSPEVETFARIKVVGVGGGGGNAVNHMVQKVKGVEFIAINTDAQDLHHSKAKKKIHIGKNLTKGLGTGMNAELARRAAEETKEDIQEALKSADMVFVTAGMGGGTGTGGSPVVANVARESGALTVGVVTKPFFFEGTQRMKTAVSGLKELQKQVDALIIIPNDRLLHNVEKETTAEDAFAMADEVLKEAVEGIADLITTAGVINVDFADIRAIMENAGSALMGVGYGSGDTRAEQAARAAINSPLLDVSIDGAKGVLFAIAGSTDLTMMEIQEAAKIVTESVDKEAKVIYGVIKDDSLKKNEVKVTVIASGFPKDQVLDGDETSGFAFSFARNDDENKKEILNSLGNLKEKTRKEEKEEVKEKPKKKEEKAETLDEEDDDDWGGVPAFLRRSKLK